MQFTKPFKGVRAGEIYPVEFEPGEECPPELVEAAIQLGAVNEPKAAEVKPNKAKAK